MSITIQPAQGRLGILTPGLGAVATTFMAGVESLRQGLGHPYGSLTQMGTIRLGKRTENRSPRISDFVPLASLQDIVFGAWDPIPDNAYEAAKKAGVLKDSDLDPIRSKLEAIRPMPAVFDNRWVKKLHGTHVKQGKTLADLAEALRHDIRTFKADNKCDRLVMVWCASTEIFLKPSAVHQTLEAFEKGLASNDPEIAPSMIYAYAALKECVPFANGAPNLTADIPALDELARANGVPISGKDFKTGQTLMKTILAPGFKSRLLGVSGWFSTNILGNRDGEVLDDPESFKTKEESKLSVLDSILQPHLYPELYGSLFHKVRINYYPPRGDEKEAWDNIDIFGWMGYPDADQDQLPLPRLDPRRADRPRPRPLQRPRPPCGNEGDPGVALVLLQEPDARSGALPGARSLHPADEAQEHAALDEGRGADHPPRHRVLRLVSHRRDKASATGDGADAPSPSSVLHRSRASISRRSEDSRARRCRRSPPAPDPPA